MTTPFTGLPISDVKARAAISDSYRKKESRSGFWMVVGWVVLGLVALTVLGTGCGSVDDADLYTVDESTAVCPFPAGRWLKTYTRVSGTCGDLEPLIDTYTGTGSMFCLDGGSATIGQTVVTEMLLWSADGSGATGTYKIEAPLGLCHGTYSVVVTSVE